MSLPEIFNEKIIGISFWKWAVLLTYIASIFFLRPLLRTLIRQLKKSIPSRADQTPHFWSYWRNLKTEKQISEILWAGLGVLIVEVLTLPTGFEKYLHHALNIWLSLHVILLVYISIDALGL